MAYYGLRPSEIVALRVDSIDWPSKTCRVSQRKTQSDIVLPLLGRTLSVERQSGWWRASIVMRKDLVQFPAVLSNA